MGVKSTVTLDRQEAISRIRELRFKLFGNQQLDGASSAWLESELEQLNDLYYYKAYGSLSGFDNYNIIN